MPLRNLPENSLHFALNIINPISSENNDMKSGRAGVVCPGFHDIFNQVTVLT